MNKRSSKKKNNNCNAVVGARYGIFVAEYVDETGEPVRATLTVDDLETFQPLLTKETWDMSGITYNALGLAKVLDQFGEANCLVRGFAARFPLEPCENCGHPDCTDYVAQRLDRSVWQKVKDQQRLAT